MSAAATPIEKAAPRALPQPLTSICAALAVLGVLAFGYGLTRDPQQAWLAFHSNFLYFALLGQGGVILACIFSTVGATWPGPYRRIAEGLGAWVPVSFVLGCVSWFGRHYLFEWSRDGAVPGKEVWLNDARVYGTDLGVLALMTVMSLVFLRRSLRPTLGGGTPGATGFAKTMSERWTSGWRGDREERSASDSFLHSYAPPLILVFALGFSIFAFDQIMSMEQRWFSNLFGAYVCWGGVLSALAWTTLLGLLHRKTPGLEGQFTEKRMHDIGKLTFAFSTFWMYLFWSQYLVIYYGNVPEETFYFLERLGPQFVVDKGYTDAAWALSWTSWDFNWARFTEGYGWVAMAVWALCWLIPFWVLLGVRPKKTPIIAGSVAFGLIIGFWLERNLLVWPAVVKGDMLAPFQLVPLCIAAGFFGAFVLVYLVYSRLFPSLAVPQSE